MLDSDPTAAIRALNELSPGAVEWRAAHTIVADAESRGVYHVLVGDGEPIGAMRFSDDGMRLAAISGAEIIVWDVATGVKSRLLSQWGNPQRTIAWAGGDIVHHVLDPLVVIAELRRQDRVPHLAAFDG